MDKQYKAVIFDLDGTLINTLFDLQNSMNYVLEKKGYPTHTYEEIKNYVGNGMQKLVERALPQNVDSNIVNDCYNKMVAYYGGHNCVDSKVYDGMEDTIKKLNKQGIKLAVLTNKIHTSALKVIDHYLKNQFDIVQGDDGIIPLKPNIDGVEMILNKWNLKTEEVIFVGDSCVDIKTAQNANMDCIALEWGYCDKNKLYGQNATYYANSAEDVFKIVMGEKLN